MSELSQKALPQGALPPQDAEPIQEDDGPSYPPVIQQALNNMRALPHCVLLTRVGSFYEVDALQTYHTLP